MMFSLTNSSLLDTHIHTLILTTDWWKTSWVIIIIVLWVVIIIIKCPWKKLSC